MIKVLLNEELFWLTDGVELEAELEVCVEVVEAEKFLAPTGCGAKRRLMVARRTSITANACDS